MLNGYKVARKYFKDNGMDKMSDNEYVNWTSETNTIYIQIFEKRERSSHMIIELVWDLFNNVVCAHFYDDDYLETSDFDINEVPNYDELKSIRYNLILEKTRNERLNVFKQLNNYSNEGVACIQ